jgi:hypothetical protein
MTTDPSELQTSRRTVLVGTCIVILACAAILPLRLLKENRDARYAEVPGRVTSVRDPPGHHDWVGVDYVDRDLSSARLDVRYPSRYEVGDHVTILVDVASRRPETLTSELPEAVELGYSLVLVGVIVGLLVLGFGIADVIHTRRIRRRSAD